MKKENGIMVPDSLTSKLSLENFLDATKEGAKISVMYEVVTDDSTHAQNNYFHKLCRVISEDTGQDVETVKKEVKIKAGYWKTKTELKSVGDASKSDFNHLIQSAIELGSDLGLNLYSI